MKTKWSLWQINGEDLIIASSERDMRAVYRAYHGESILPHMSRVQLDPNHVLQMTDDGETVEKMTAAEVIELHSARHKCEPAARYIACWL